MSEDAGVYFTKRDRALLNWLIKYGVVDYPYVQKKLFQDRRSICLRRLRRYKSLGLVEEKGKLNGSSFLRISPTKAKEVANLLRKDVKEVESTNLHRPTFTTAHSIFCSKVGIELESLLDQGRLITESQMLYLGMQFDLEIEHDGRQKHHRPDLIHSSPETTGVYTAFEIELSAKAIRRVRTTLKAYLESCDFEKVIYFYGNDYLSEHLKAIYEHLWSQVSKQRELLSPDKVIFCNIHEFLKEPLLAQFESVNGSRFIEDVLPVELSEHSSDEISEKRGCIQKK